MFKPDIIKFARQRSELLTIVDFDRSLSERSLFVKPKAPFFNALYIFGSHQLYRYPLCIRNTFNNGTQTRNNVLDEQRTRAWKRSSPKPR